MFKTNYSLWSQWLFQEMKYLIENTCVCILSLLKQHRSFKFPQTTIYCGFWQEVLKINKRLRYLSFKIFNAWM